MLNDSGDERDLLSVVSEYVPMEKRGPEVYSGLCPFHKETTPSFLVNTHHQLFACLSCGAAGTADNFKKRIAQVVERTANAE